MNIGSKEILGFLNTILLLNAGIVAQRDVICRKVIVR